MFEQITEMLTELNDPDNETIELVAKITMRLFNAYKDAGFGDETAVKLIVAATSKK